MINVSESQNPLILSFLDYEQVEFVLRSAAKVTGYYEIQWGNKLLLDLDNADDLSIPDKNVGKINELWSF